MSKPEDVPQLMAEHADMIEAGREVRRIDQHSATVNWVSGKESRRDKRAVGADVPDWKYDPRWPQHPTIVEVVAIFEVDPAGLFPRSRREFHIFDNFLV